MRLLQNCLIPLANTRLIALLGVLFIHGNTLTATAYQDETYISEEPPYAIDDGITTTYDESYIFDPLENDYGVSAPIDPSSITIVTPPAFGSVQVDSETGYMEYTPNPDIIGIDMFEYTVADTNGNVSNIAAVWVDVLNSPPELLEFTVREGVADMWHFEGRVSDENPENVTIHFGGLLEGRTVSVNSDGTFQFNKLILDGIGGGVSAQAVDQFGEESEILYDEVFFF